MTWVLSFILGYTVGRIDGIKALLTKSETEKPVSFLQQSRTDLGKKKQVTIDDSTFVTDVSTDTLQRAHGEIGKTTVAQDSIDASVSKLAQLKGKKG